MSALPKWVSIGSDATYLEVKAHVLSTTITCRCQFCGRRNAVLVLPLDFEAWLPHTGLTVGVVCCVPNSYWARWHEAWKRRLRNRRKNRIRKLKR